MSGDTRNLLKSLVIDREAQAASEVASARAAKMRLMLGGAMLLGAVAAGAAVWWLKPDSAATVADAGTAENAASPQMKTVSAPAAGNMIASGFVVARRQATVAAQIIGEVRSVEVEEGQIVKAGQVLARLDSDLAAADLARAEAQGKATAATAKAAAADLAEATRILNRTSAIAAKGYASEADLTRTEARVETLKAQVEQARAQAEAAKTAVRAAAVALSRYTIRAPFDGVVTDKAAQPGEIISPMSAGTGFTRTGICTIVDMDSLEVDVDVNEALIARVKAGGKAEATLDAYPDWRIPAHVIAIVPTAQRDKATVRVRVGFDQKDPRILPEMAVKVTFLENSPAVRPARQGE